MTIPVRKVFKTHELGRQSIAEDPQADFLSGLDLLQLLYRKNWIQISGNCYTLLGISKALVMYEGVPDL